MADALPISGNESAKDLRAKIDSGDSFTLDAAAIIRFVTRYIDGGLNEQELEEIGDLIEGAEFIDYVGPGSDGLLAQVVYEFSTPPAEGKLTPEMAGRWLQLLS